MEFRHNLNLDKSRLQLSRRQASRRRAQAPRERWARPGAACQWARPAQLRVNHAPQSALPAAAGIRAPRLGSSGIVRLDPGHGPGHIAARDIHVKFRGI